MNSFKDTHYLIEVAESSGYDYDSTRGVKIECPSSFGIGAGVIYAKFFSLGIVLVSLIIRILYSAFVRCIRFRSKSFELKIIIYAICAVYVINYIYVYAYTPMIREGTELRYDPNQENAELLMEFGNLADTNSVFNPEGLYSDFSNGWFSDIGS